jgi:hypothetical protein
LNVLDRSTDGSDSGAAGLYDDYVSHLIIFLQENPDRNKSRCLGAEYLRPLFILVNLLIYAFCKKISPMLTAACVLTVQVAG